MTFADDRPRIPAAAGHPTLKLNQWSLRRKPESRFVLAYAVSIPRCVRDWTQFFNAMTESTVLTGQRELQSGLLSNFNPIHYPSLDSADINVIDIKYRGLIPTRIFQYTL